LGRSANDAQQCESTALLSDRCRVVDSDDDGDDSAMINIERSAVAVTLNSAVRQMSPPSTATRIDCVLQFWTSSLRAPSAAPRSPPAAAAAADAGGNERVARAAAAATPAA
jgi:hypothetical protein